MTEIWVVIDEYTNRIVGFGSQSEAQQDANDHSKLSGNKTIIRKLKRGWMVWDY